MYKEIKINKEIRKRFNKNYIFEMTNMESAFLCGLLEKKHPHKILEVGVAEGGTSALIMDYMENYLGIFDYELHSVDINAELYTDNKRLTGYCVDIAYNDKLIIGKNHFKYFGYYLPEVIDKIGDGIDFIILDTVHQIPGEIFDALIVIPYLKNGGIICFHDLSIDHQICTYGKGIVNNVLFHILSGDKYMNVNDYDYERLGDYPNIAAVEKTDETEKNIQDVFSALSLPWTYIPDEYQINLYIGKYKEKYNDCLVALFEKNVKLNKKSYYRNKQIIYEEMRFSHKLLNDGIYIYGVGKMGKKLCEILITKNINILGFVVSNGYKTKNSYNNYPILELKDVDTSKTIILSIYNTEIMDMLDDLGYLYINMGNYFLKMLS